MIFLELTTNGSEVTLMNRVFEHAKFSSDKIFSFSFPNAFLFESVTGIIVGESSCDLPTSS